MITYKEIHFLLTAALFSSPIAFKVAKHGFLSHNPPSFPFFPPPPSPFVESLPFFEYQHYFFIPSMVHSVCIPMLPCRKCCKDIKNHSVINTQKENCHSA